MVSKMSYYSFDFEKMFFLLICVGAHPAAGILGLGPVHAAASHSQLREENERCNLCIKATILLTMTNFFC